MAKYGIRVQSISTDKPVIDMELTEEEVKTLAESLGKVLQDTCSFLEAQGTDWELLSHNILPAGNRLIISFLVRH